jgi:cbb3-type cytochrome oxidase maturation protein
MSVLMWLAPLSLFLGGLGLVAFLWTFRAGQYDDPKGAAARILDDHLDEGPPRRKFPPG